jgi:hypothetical protein
MATRRTTITETKERDRRLSQIDDLFTVELVVSDIQWKLQTSGESGQDASSGFCVPEPNQEEESHGSLAPCG